MEESSTCICRLQTRGNHETAARVKILRWHFVHNSLRTINQQRMLPEHKQPECPVVPCSNKIAKDDPMAEQLLAAVEERHHQHAVAVAKRRLLSV